MTDINLFILYALVSRLSAILLLAFLVLPIQWKELNRQWKQRHVYKGVYWKLALNLMVIVLITVAFSVIPLTYQSTQLDRPAEMTLQNWSSFFTNTIILLQSIGWVLIYRLGVHSQRATIK